MSTGSSKFFPSGRALKSTQTTTVIRKTSPAPMRAAMTAERVAKALGGRKVGSRWMARCPVHADHNPSLSIQSGNDGKILVCCFAGCEQHRVIAVLKARGLWSESGRGNAKGISRSFMAADSIGARDAEMRQLAARILERTTAAGGTIVETYFGSRHIVIPVPPAIRFHTALKHPAAADGRR